MAGTARVGACMDASPPIETFLQPAVDKRASDIYFTTDAPVTLRIQGQIHSICGSSEQPLTSADIEQWAMSLMSDEQQAEFAAERELDFAVSFGATGRFRVNVFRQQGSVAMVLRNIGNVPTMAEFDMPGVFKRGLVLVVGAAGSGKSTTLGAMVNHRNENAGGHILTLEDPIEFMHRHKRSIVNQRELGRDTHSFARAAFGHARGAGRGAGRRNA